MVLEPRTNTWNLVRGGEVDGNQQALFRYKIAFYRKVIININLIFITFGGSKLNYPVLLVQMVINNPRPFGVCVFTRLDDHFWAHPKVLNCSDGAIALWTRALSWVGFY